MLKIKLKELGGKVVGSKIINAYIFMSGNEVAAELDGAVDWIRETVKHGPLYLTVAWNGNDLPIMRMISDKADADGIKDRLVDLFLKVRKYNSLDSDIITMEGFVIPWYGKRVILGGNSR